jgi:thiamine-monophosphate kinase
VSAGIDVSDGLLADAAHVATASGVCLRIDEGRIPIDPGLAELPPARRLELSLTGGEDYEILFTAPVAARDSLEEWGAGGPPGPRPSPSGRRALTRIGEVVAGEGVVRVGPGGERIPVSGGGFDHFAEGGR